MSHTRWIAALFATLLWGQTSLAQSQLVIGVRADAPPFSYRDGEAETGYSGYVVDICKRVLDAMALGHSFDVEFREVEAADRFDDLSDGKLDILCDPATINQKRLKMPGLIASQPIYLSGIGMATATRRPQWVAHWPCIGPIVGVVEGTTTRSAVIERMVETDRFGVSFGQKIAQHPEIDVMNLSERELSQFHRCKEKAEKDNVDVALLTTAETPAPVLKTYSDHSALAAAVCRQEVMFSVGDLEIIATALKRTKSKDPDCEYRVDPKVTSEERYGIFVHVADQMDESDKLALDFLRDLSIEIHRGRDSVLVSSFRENLDASKISSTLDAFFWNVIAGDG